MQGVVRLSSSQGAPPDPSAFADVFQWSTPLEHTLEDSPMLRKHIRDAEADLEDLTQYLKRLVGSTRRCQQAASAFEEGFRLFADDLQGFRKVMGVSGPAGEALEKGFVKFSATLREISNFRSVLFQQMEVLLATPMTEFINTDIKGLKEHSKKYERSVAQYDTVLSKLGQIKKRNAGKVHEVEQELAEAKRTQNLTTLDYVHRMNEVNARKKFEFGERLAVFMYSQQAFFLQGAELFRDLEPHLRKYSSYLQATRKNFETERTNVNQHKTTLEQFARSGATPLSPPTTHPSSTSPSSSPGPSSHPSIASPGPFKKGWLIKRSEDMINSWHRRYFVLKDGHFYYYRTGEEARPDLDFNLLLCTVKLREDLDRRCCFEIVSPSTSFVLQAESQEQMSEWVAAMQAATSAALNAQSTGGRGRPTTSALSSSGNSSGLGVSPLQTLRNVSPANCVCADCEAREPDWISINLGALLCIDCSGVHRSLGVHISKVRSLSLDKWDKSMLELMCALGNETVNRIYEAQVPSYFKKPTAHDPSEVRQRWIREKYVRKGFVNKYLNGADDEIKLNENLVRASGTPDVPLVLQILAQGGSVNYKQQQEGETHGFTPLHLAVVRDLPLNVELLIMNGANADSQNDQGDTPLHLAAREGLAHIAGVLLLKCSVKLLSVCNRAGHSALDMAMDSGQADCATLLRLAQLAKDENQSNFEESFGEALRSFSHEAQLKGSKVKPFSV